MTVKVTTLKMAAGGAKGLAAYYTKEGLERPGGRPSRGNGLEGYYGVKAGEWFGAGADRLAVSGEVAARQLEAVLSGVDPVTGERLGRAFGGGAQRQATVGFDVTFAAPKDVSLLWGTGDPLVRLEIEQAQDAAVRAVMAHLESRSATRVMADGVQRRVIADGLIAAAFPEYTSRAGDPNLHTHVVVSAKVFEHVRGRWQALDARELKMFQRTWSGLYHRALEAELSTRLGVEFVSDSKKQWVAGRIVGFPVLAERVMSKRTLQIEAQLQQHFAEFQAEYGRKPTRQERWRIERRTAESTRGPKLAEDEGQCTDLHAAWTDELEAAGIHVTEIQEVLGRTRPQEPDIQKLGSVASRAWVATERSKSLFNRNDVAIEVARALPPGAGGTAARTVAQILHLADSAIAQHGLGVKEPSSITSDVLPHFTTQRVIDSEQAIITIADNLNHSPSPPNAKAVNQSSDGVVLGEDQAEIAARAAGSERHVLVIGPAGTGKSEALAAAVKQLTTDGRPVLQLAPTAVAADQLATLTGEEAITLDAFVQRLADGRLELQPGLTLIVDEAGMAHTDHLNTVYQTADRAGGRLVLVGDDLQFSAVGRGGMFSHLIRTNPEAVSELGTVRRFAAEWEQQASLQLRQADPNILTTYADHGRLRSGTRTESLDAVLAQWAVLTADGDTVGVFAPTQATVDELNQRIQQHRQNLNQLSQHYVTTGAGTALHVGDLIVSRANTNPNEIATNTGKRVHNRDIWTIAAVSASSVTAESTNDPAVSVELPAAYVQEHVQLGYAQTSHGGQGRTYDHAILLRDTPTDAPGIYVPMTRGRHSNTVHTTYDPDIENQASPVDILTEDLTRNRWAELPLVDREIIHQPADPAPTPQQPVQQTELLTDQELRELFTTYATALAHCHNADHQLAQQRHRREQLQTATSQARRQNIQTRRLHARLTARIEQHQQQPARIRARSVNRQELKKLKTQLADTTKRLASTEEAIPVAQAAMKEWGGDLVRIANEPDTTASRDNAARTVQQLDTTLGTDTALRAQIILEQQQNPEFIKAYGTPPTIHQELWAHTHAIDHQHHTAYPNSRPVFANEPGDAGQSYSQARLTIASQQLEATLNPLREEHELYQSGPELTL